MGMNWRSMSAWYDAKMRPELLTSAPGWCVIVIVRATEDPLDCVLATGAEEMGEVVDGREPEAVLGVEIGFIRFARAGQG